MNSKCKFLLAVFFQLAFSSISHSAQAKNKPAELRYNSQFVLKQILARKNKEFKPEIELPKIFVESKTPLTQFQDALFPQWGFRPDVFTNAFADQNNEIYLIDDANYYQAHDRCMDDSLAHELTHYVQSKYQGFDLNDESLEWDAIDVQSWFRDQFCK